MHIECFQHFSQIKDEEQKAYKFYNELDNDQGISILDDLKSYSAIRSWITKNESKLILAKLVRNINLIISDYPENPKKRCREINYWMNEQIKKCNNKCETSLSSDSSTVFNDIKWNRVNNDIVCKRETVPYPTKDIDLMKELDNYCEFRNNLRCDKFQYEEELLKYNTYIKEKRQHFRIYACKIHNKTLQEKKI
ncbi:hypothetical protein PVC01_130005300 [Plasmodium vivax]|uniref:Vir protein n=1 Tax=Plasmodium vivax TaxID=5855 RepID=A0A1G4HI23_PLAVI|nr:hypothetical protein PVC01_130005300 [Plasmodium vivax]